MCTARGAGEVDVRGGSDFLAGLVPIWICARRTWLVDLTPKYANPTLVASSPRECVADVWGRYGLRDPQRVISMDRARLVRHWAVRQTIRPNRFGSHSGRGEKVDSRVTAVVLGLTKGFSGVTMYGFTGWAMGWALGLVGCTATRRVSIVVNLRHIAIFETRTIVPSLAPPPRLRLHFRISPLPRLRRARPGAPLPSSELGASRAICIDPCTVCMTVCMCMHTSAHAVAHAYLHMHMHMHICAMHMCTCTRTRPHAHVGCRTSTCTWTCTSLALPRAMCMCTSVKRKKPDI